MLPALEYSCQNGKLAFDDKIFDDGLGNMTRNITGINLDGSDSVSIASQAPEPIVGEEQLYIYSTMNYSADGSKIVFSMRDTISGTSNIYIANSDGSSRQQLTSYQQTDGRAAFYPHFSLDGSKIVYSLFTTTEDTTLAQIYTINNDGSGNGLFAISGSDNCDSHPVY